MQHRKLEKLPPHQKNKTRATNYKNMICLEF